MRNDCVKEKGKKKLFCKGEQEYVTCVLVLSRGNATLTQKIKGRTRDRGKMVLIAPVPTSEIPTQKLDRNTFIPAN